MFSVSPGSIKKLLFTLTLFSICTLFSSTLFAWPTVNGVPVCTATDDQQNPSIASDSTGGYFLAWQDWRNGVEQNIYAQHVNSQGSTLWIVDGLAICTANGDQINPAVVSDGAGGAIIAWRDNRSGHNNDPGVYAQRITSTGSTLWKINGIAISTVYNGAPSIISDGASGAIILWDYIGSGLANQVYIQRVNSQGSTLWGTINLPSSWTYQSKLVSDGFGGAIVAYEAGLFTSAFVQRVNSQGSTLWGASPVMVGTQGNSYLPSVISDGAGGALVTWQDGRSGTTHRNDIYVQSLNSQGSTLWITNGIAICTSGNEQINPLIVSDGIGGAIITWQDYRSTTVDQAAGAADIYAQRVNSSGSTLWLANGIAICTSLNDQINPLMVSDGAGGAIITWTDYRSTTGSPGQGAEIYAQRVNSNGSTLWAANGVSVCTAVGDQTIPMMVGNGSGGVVIAWQDHRGSDWDIYAQSVYSTGVLPVEDWVMYGRNSSKALCSFDW
jgi:hypothetical protein